MPARPLGPFRRVARVVAVLAALGVGALCCQQVLSIDGAVVVSDASVDAEAGSSTAVDAPPDVRDAAAEAVEMVDACGMSMPSGLCASCVTVQCCSQLHACAADSLCSPIETCLLACGSDYACRAACVLQNPVTAPFTVPTLDACVAAQCNLQCGMACGQAGSYTLPDAADGCQSCIATANGGAVCKAVLNCDQNVACEISGHCAYACPTPDCRLACASDGGDDNALVTGTILAGALCYHECTIGEDWFCSNNVKWPTPTSTTQQVTLTIEDANNDPIPGVAAMACGMGDDTCAHPLSSGTTDSAGKVTLINLGSAFVFGFQGHFQLQPPAAYVPSIYFLSFPLSVTDAQLTLSLVAQTDYDKAFAALGISPLSGRGDVWAVAMDCLQIPSSRVVVKADGLNDPLTHELYYAGGDPAPSATSTDVTGGAFFLNAPQGELTLHAIPDATGVESSMAIIDVEPGMLSIVWLLPTAIP